MKFIKNGKTRPFFQLARQADSKNSKFFEKSLFSIFKGSWRAQALLNIAKFWDFVWGYLFLSSLISPQEPQSPQESSRVSVSLSKSQHVSGISTSLSVPKWVSRSLSKYQWVSLSITKSQEKEAYTMSGKKWYRKCQKVCT